MVLRDSTLSVTVSLTSAREPCGLSTQRSKASHGKEEKQGGFVAAITDPVAGPSPTRVVAATAHCSLTTARSQGRQATNCLLSSARARAVAAILEAHGVPASSVAVVGQGSSNLVAAGPLGRQPPCRCHHRGTRWVIRRASGLVEQWKIGFSEVNEPP